MGIQIDNKTHAILKINSDNDFASNGAEVGDVILAVDGFRYKEADYLTRALMGKPDTEVKSPCGTVMRRRM